MSSAPALTRLSIEGLTCASCARHVADALRALPGVDTVDVRPRDGKALVRHDPDRAALPALLAAVLAAGYGSDRAVTGTRAER